MISQFPNAGDCVIDEWQAQSAVFIPTAPLAHLSTNGRQELVVSSTRSCDALHNRNELRSHENATVADALSCRTYCSCCHCARLDSDRSQTCRGSSGETESPEGLCSIPRLSAKLNQSPSCEPCRISKIRCDHATPTCQKCQTRGITEQVSRTNGRDLRA